MSKKYNEKFYTAFDVHILSTMDRYGFIMCVCSVCFERNK